MSFIEKLKNYEEGLSYTVYRFDKISNFLTFKQYKEAKVKAFAGTLINEKGE